MTLLGCDSHLGWIINHHRPAIVQRESHLLDRKCVRWWEPSMEADDAWLASKRCDQLPEASHLPLPPLYAVVFLHLGPSYHDILCHVSV